MKLNLAGHTYGRWTVLEFVGLNKHRFALWKCRCACGTEKTVSSNEMRTGNSRSCGCLQRETARRVGLARAGYNRTHGMTKTPEYGAYHNARQRCENTNCEAYPDYGGRGIKFNFPTFSSFLSEVGPRPSDEHSLDRIDNNGHYEPGNLRWATMGVQLANRRVKRLEDFSMAELTAEVNRRSWTETVEGYLRDGKTVSGGKGDSTLKSQEAAQANFTNTLMQSYKTQFAQQSGILSFLTGKLQPMIDNPTGFSADALTSMRTGATENTARSYAQSEQALHEAEAARGGSTLPSGVNAQLEAENANAGAAQNVQSQEGITLANEQQKQQNYWSAVSALSGNASQYNPTGYAGQATSGSGAVGDLGTAYKNSQSSQLLGALGGIAGGVGGAVGGYFTGKKG